MHDKQATREKTLKLATAVAGESGDWRPYSLQSHFLNSAYAKMQECRDQWGKTGIRCGGELEQVTAVSVVQMSPEPLSGGPDGDQQAAPFAGYLAPNAQNRWQSP